MLKREICIIRSDGLSTKLIRINQFSPDEFSENTSWKLSISLWWNSYLMKEVTESRNELRLSLWQIWKISGHSQTNLDKIEKEKKMKMIGRSEEVCSVRHSHLLLKHCLCPSDHATIRRTDRLKESYRLLIKRLCP